MPSTPPSVLKLDQALGPWAWWPTMMPAPLLGDSQGRAGKPTACEDVPKASCSPLEMAKGGSRATTLSTVASMTSSSDTTISLEPSALWGMPTAVMAGPMARMPAPFEEEPPSLGGGEGIVEPEDKYIHRDLGSNPIVVTPFPRIPLYSWYRNLT